MKFVCSCCGETHDGLPQLGFDRPSYADSIPPEEFETRVQLDSDHCVVDEEHFFIRGCIEIPVRGLDETFTIGVWVSQAEQNYQTYVQNSDSSEIGPFFGWLSNAIVFNGHNTLNLKTMVHFPGGNLRPNIVLEPTDHPLSVGQGEGMDLEAVMRLVHEHVDNGAV